MLLAVVLYNIMVTPDPCVFAETTLKGDAVVSVDQSAFIYLFIFWEGEIFIT